MRLEDLRGPSCVVCGADMEGRRSHAIYCSPRCRSIAYVAAESAALAEARAGRTCPTCGRTFDARRSDQRHCCNECMMKPHRRRWEDSQDAARERSCSWCGKTCHPRPGGLYCSMRCAAFGREARKRAALRDILSRSIAASEEGP